MILSWIAHRWLGFAMRRLCAGDPRWILLMDHPDVVFTFPGQSSWAGVHRGRAAHRTWLERFCRAGLRIAPDEVVVTGLPWRQTVCVRGTDGARGPDGSPVYENRYVLRGHLRSGRLTDYEVYEDTERTAAYDAWLEATGHPAAASRRDRAATRCAPRRFQGPGTNRESPVRCAATHR